LENAENPSFSQNLNYQLRHKHSQLMAKIWIGVVRMGLADAVGKQQIVLAAVPIT
jgi:hypothetical protein